MERPAKTARNLLSGFGVDSDILIDRLAPTRVTVLIDGGSDEARGSVARALHTRSRRNREPFVSIDCAGCAHPELQRVLGQPTSQRARLTAGQGTLYVANVEALPLWLHACFLGYLDAAQRPRVVVGTGIDLAAAARGGRFRADLCERLCLVRIALADPS